MAYIHNVSLLEQWTYMAFQCVQVWIWPHFSGEWHWEEFEKSPVPSCGMWALATARRKTGKEVSSRQSSGGRHTGEITTQNYTYLVNPKWPSSTTTFVKYTSNLDKLPKCCKLKCWSRFYSYFSLATPGERGWTHDRKTTMSNFPLI